MSEGNGQEFSNDIKELGDKIVALTVGKAVELGDYLEKVHGIKPAGGAVVMAGGGGGGGGASAEKVEQTEFTVTLDSFDAAKKITVIKVVRELTGLGLKEAKDLVEGAPKPVKENLPKAEAEGMKKKLEEAGAKVSLK